MPRLSRTFWHCVEDKQTSQWLTIEALSEHFCQDSFLFVPRGGEDSFLVGTNDAEFPGYGNEESTGEFLGGKEGEFMTRVGKTKRPIRFAEGLETKAKMQNNTKFLISRLAKQVLQEMKGDS